MKDGEDEKKSIEENFFQQTNQKAKSNLQTATVTVGLCNITDITMTTNNQTNQNYTHYNSYQQHPQLIPSHEDLILDN